MAQRTTHTISIFPLASDDDERRSEAEQEDDLSFLHGRERLDPLTLARYQRPPAALRSIQQLISTQDDPELVARCCLEAGQIREQLGEFEAAVSAYREAARQEPRDPEVRYFAHNNLGYCLNRLGQHREAEATCRLAISIDGARFNAHKNLGIALELQGRSTEATRSYARAVRAESGDPRALRRLRILLARHPELKRDQPELLELVPPSAHELSELAARRIERLLASIQVYEPVGAAGLQVFGLRWSVGNGFAYRTLDEALAAGALDVTEVTEQGRVPEVQVRNRLDERVFLMAGEELVGAKQNRVLNASILLGSRAEMPLPVSCVEQGRWSQRTRGFRTAGTSSHSALRQKMAAFMKDSYIRHGRPISDQGAVWHEVARKLSAHKTASASHALHEAFESMEGRLDEISRKIEVQEHWCGAAFAVGGEIVGLDLFDRPATLSKLWPKLLRSYAIDALERSRLETTARDEVEGWVRSFDRLAIEGFPSPGLGTDLRMEGPGMDGAMLMVDDHPVHLEVFAHEEM